MSAIVDVLSWVLLLTGGSIAVLAGVGINRLPDVFSRMHAAGMLDTLGAVCIVFGLVLQTGLTIMAIKLVLMLIFLMVTTSTAGHALAKSALARGLVPQRNGAPDAPAVPRPEGEEVSSSPR